MPYHAESVRVIVEDVEPAALVDDAVFPAVGLDVDAVVVRRCCAEARRS
jgi:hypothetical protein